MDAENSQIRRVVVTDLDGTLLESSTYSAEFAMPAINYLKQHEISLVFCSSKTSMEQLYYQGLLNINHPFIVENGSAIFIPKDYFPFEFPYDRQTDTHDIIELGVHYSKLDQHVRLAREQTGAIFTRFEDLSPEEICQITDLPNLEAAERATRREYSTTLVSGDFDSENFQDFIQYLRSRGLHATRGTRFLTISGAASDKGKAVLQLLELFEQAFGKIVSYGLGDGRNDLPMLAAVDYAFLVQRLDGTWLEGVDDKINKVTGVGPVGWSTTVLNLILTGNSEPYG